MFYLLTSLLCSFSISHDEVVCYISSLLYNIFPWTVPIPSKIEFCLWPCSNLLDNIIFYILMVIQGGFMTGIHWQRIFCWSSFVELMQIGTSGSRSARDAVSLNSLRYSVVVNLKVHLWHLIVSKGLAVRGCNLLRAGFDVASSLLLAVDRTRGHRQ